MISNARAEYLGKTLTSMPSMASLLEDGLVSTQNKHPEIGNFTFHLHAGVVPNSKLRTHSKLKEGGHHLLSQLTHKRLPSWERALGFLNTR